MNVRIISRAGAVTMTAAFAALTVSAAPATAAPVLDTVTATVDVDEQGTAIVEMSYIVSADDESVETLSFSALTFGEASAQDIEISTADGQSLEVTAEPEDLKTAVTVALDAPVQPGEQVQLVVEYSVPQAGTIDGERMTVETPVLTLDHPAATTSSGIFTATVTLPAGYTYVEGFPSTPDDVTEADGRAQVHYDAPAAVSLLRLVSTTGDTPFWTLQTTVNIILIVVLLAGGVALYFSFTRGQRRAAEIAAAEATGANADDAGPRTPERSH